MFGLTDKDLQFIVEVMKDYPQIDEAIIFGSRALQTYRKGSDIDLALKGKDIAETTYKISASLNEESPLPYYFDVLDYNLIDNDDLKDHIDRIGKQIYKKADKN